MSSHMYGPGGLSDFEFDPLRVVRVNIGLPKLAIQQRLV